MIGVKDAVGVVGIGGDRGSKVRSGSRGGRAIGGKKSRRVRQVGGV